MIEVLPDAKPGLYPFDVRVRDETEGVVLWVERSALLVLRRGVAKELARHYSRAKQMFVECGSNGLLWYALRYIFPGGAGFRQSKELYEFIVGRVVSSGTVSNILARMIREDIANRVRIALDIRFAHGVLPAVIFL